MSPNSKINRPTAEEEDSSVSRFFFGILWTLSQVGLWGSPLLFLYWTFKFDRGFDWATDRGKQFNLHAMLMLTGFIFLNGQAMLIYKTFTCCKKIYLKIVHTIIFVLSTSCITFGIIAAIQAQHNVAPNQTPQHFYSMHSWFGLIAVGLFALQFLVGFVSFLVLLCCDKATASFRAKLLPTHITFGLIIFSLAIATCLSGLLQVARHRLSGPTDQAPNKPDYKHITNPQNPFLNPGLTINMVAVCLLLLAVIMPYMVRNFNQHRRHRSFRIS